MVPKAEKKMLGVGDREESWPAQVAVSPETKLVSLAGGVSPVTGGVRREIVSTRVTAGLEIRLVRIWEPCWLCDLAQVLRHVLD